MYRVKNKKAVCNLSDKNFRASRIRNAIAVLAIILTTVLFTTLFTITSGMVENIQRQTMREAGGDGMGVLKYITDEEYEAVKNHKLISEISYNRMLCDDIKNEELLKRHGELYYMDDTAMKLGFCEPTTGRKPEAANEIIMDTKAMKLLGIPQEPGAPVRLILNVHGKEVVRDFVLCGFWEADPVFNASIMVTSYAYMQEHMDELYNSYKENFELTGAINSYIMFHNSFNLENKLARVITESGYSVTEGEPDYMMHNVNWAYLSTNFELDLGTVFGVVAVAALIIFTGYLIIYNIFQISVIRDIRFYGLLKTIGTTGRQIRTMIRRQALQLSCIGIPVGLLSGYFIGCRLVPVIMNQSAYRGAQFETSPNPLIFIGSILFALITVAVSTAKPGRIASLVSPVEAVKYTDQMVHVKGKHRRKRGRTGSGIAGMAASNLSRNKRRTLLVILSMSLSLVLFNTLYTMSLGFDMDKYLATFVDTDFQIAHADYFNNRYGGSWNEVSETMIEAVKEQPGFEAGGRYLNNSYGTWERFTAEEPENYVTLWGFDNRDEKGNILCEVYGTDDFTLGRLEVTEGELDIEKLKTGRYILEGVELDDNGAVIEGSSHYEIGDKVVLHSYRGTSEKMEENEYCTWEYEVLAKVKVKYYTNSVRRYGGFSAFYIPEEIYCSMVSDPGVMCYVFNVSDGEEAAVEVFLKNYTENVEPVMNYSSKAVHEAEFEDMRNMVMLVGGMLSFIIGLIGVLNFINSVLTSIITRKREFAMLESVGMTKKQLRRMLLLEGFYYTAGASAVTVILSLLMSLFLVRGLGQNLWFFSYHFTAMPLVVTIPVLLLIGCVLPYLLTGLAAGQSIVERLRECE